MKKLFTMMFLSAVSYASAQTFTVNELTATGSETLYHVLYGMNDDWEYSYDGYNVHVRTGAIDVDTRTLTLNRTPFSLVNFNLREFSRAIITYQQAVLYNSLGDNLGSGNRFLDNPNQLEVLKSTRGWAVTASSNILSNTHENFVYSAIWLPIPGEFNLLRAKIGTDNYRMVIPLRFATARKVNIAVFGEQ